jgi:hypothetical protein
MLNFGPRAALDIGCAHSDDIGVWDGRSLFLCRVCKRMLCIDCARAHEHQTVPMVRRPKTCSTQE